jgi:hypothetical protein
MLGPNVNLVIAIWFEVFKHLELNNLAKMKYYDIAIFLEAYPEFIQHDEEEVRKLMGLANWVNIMTQFIPAKANKGLMIGVIPKYIEGYTIRYVTGSGQKKSTQDRVHVYEVEGRVKAVQRNTMRKHHSSDHGSTKARKASGSSSMKSGSKKKSVSDEDSDVSPRPNKRNRSYESSSDASHLSRPHEGFRGSSSRSASATPSAVIDLDLVSESDDYTDSYHSSNDGSRGQDPAANDRDEVTSELSEEPLDIDLDELDSFVLEKPPLLRNFTWGTDTNRIGGGYRAAEDDLLLASVPDHKSLTFSGSSLLPPDLLLSQTILV